MANDRSVIWSAVPAGSTIQVQTDGDKRTYDFVALVKLNGNAQPSLEINDVDPGPATIAVEAAQRWAIAPTLITTSPLDKAIKLKARVLDSTGAVVQVPDGQGGKAPAEAEWQSGQTAGSTLEVSIFVRSAAS